MIAYQAVVGAINRREMVVALRLDRHDVRLRVADVEDHGLNKASAYRRREVLHTRRPLRWKKKCK